MNPFLCVAVYLSCVTQPLFACGHGNGSVKPHSIMVIYQPHEFIQAKLDKIKASHELNVHTETDWKIIWKWNYDSENVCRPLNESTDGKTLWCGIRLDGVEYNQETYLKLGSLINFINFTYCMNSTCSCKRFFLPCYVKPGNLSGAFKIQERGSTWLLIRITISGIAGDVYRYLCNSSSNNCSQNEQMSIFYMVSSLQETDQNIWMSESKEFERNHGFFRNLQDDVAACRSASTCSHLNRNETSLWNCSQSHLDINITDLMPYTHYNITIIPQARYPGEKHSFNFNETFTIETIPLEGPQLGISPFMYKTENNSDCVTVHIMFKEIPRVLRRAEVKNYSLSATPVNLSQLHQSSCSSDGKELKLTASCCQFILPRLNTHIAYNITLWADVRAGKSPVTHYIIPAKSDIAAIAPVNFVFRKKEVDSAVFHFTVRQPSRTDNEPFEYYIHHCYAKGRERCLTNLNTSALPWDGISNNFSINVPVVDAEYTLHPIFFISAIVKDGYSSELVPIGYDQGLLYVKYEALSGELKLKDIIIIISLVYQFATTRQWIWGKYFA